MRKSHQVKSSLLRDIPKSQLTQYRSGVILYTKDQDQIKFVMGVDTRTNDITDFGGHKEKTDKNIVCTGLRELVEESLGVFGKITEEEIQDSLVLYSSQMMIIFIYIDMDIEHINTTFDRLRIVASRDDSKVVKPVTSLEVKGLIWLSSKKLKEIVTSVVVEMNNLKMYKRVRIFMLRYIISLGKAVKNKNDNISYQENVTEEASLGFNIFIQKLFE